MYLLKPVRLSLVLLIYLTLFLYTEIVFSQECIKNGGNCNSRYTTAHCCSGECSYGKHAAICTEPRHPPKVKECVKDNDSCQTQDKNGRCCSGVCEAENHVCMKKSSVNEVPRGSGSMHAGERGGLHSSHIIAIVFGVLIVILLIIIIIIILRRRNKKKNVLTYAEVREFLQGGSEQVQKSNSNYIHQNVDMVPYDKKFEVSEENFVIDHQNVLGSGAYGIVLRGSIRGSSVAVKTVKPNVDTLYIKALLSELKVMAYIGKHPNIVNLLGANTTKLRFGKVYLFVELCSNGSLEEYLRGRRDQFINQILTNEEGGPRTYANIVTDPMESGYICTSDLLTWSVHIANGMKYLAEKKVVHADLATRNVLLTDKLVAKITDFGLSRKLYEYTNYVKTKQEPLPWRWMAIESLRDLKFSTQSDVWSFGITLWEIFSLATVPYPGLHWSNGFIDDLLQNLRPKKPIYATDEVYDLMSNCWNLDPNTRPTFSDLYKDVLRISDRMKNYTNLDY